MIDTTQSHTGKFGLFSTEGMTGNQALRVVTHWLFFCFVLHSAKDVDAGRGLPVPDRAHTARRGHYRVSFLQLPGQVLPLSSAVHPAGEAQHSRLICQRETETFWQLLKIDRPGRSGRGIGNSESKRPGTDTCFMQRKREREGKRERERDRFRV